MACDGITSVLRYFAFKHLPERLQVISKPFSELAHEISEREGADPYETAVSLRKLLEAKDAAVRAAL